MKSASPHRSTPAGHKGRQPNPCSYRFVWGLTLLLTAISPAATTFDDLALPPQSHWNGADGAGGFDSGGGFFTNNYNLDWEAWDGFAYSNRTDTQTRGIDGQYTAIAGVGQGRSPNYAVACVGWAMPPTVTFETPRQLGGLYVTNCNYAYYDMLDGSPFSKKFGGQTGDDEDWLKLTITGLDAAGEIAGTVDFYLADFRAADNGLDYILDTWAFVDLNSLGVVQTLTFQLDSSDRGIFGMNTPGYFCLDTIVPGPGITTFYELELPPESHWNGADGTGGFHSGEVSFVNNYNADWEAWDGFAYSNQTDAQATGIDAQYVAVTGSGQGGSPNYAVAFVGWETLPTVTFDTPRQLGGLFVTNCSYAYFDMLDGSLFSKKFGGQTGDDQDWLKLTVTGLDATDEITGTVEFYLADFRAADNSLRYILDTWAFVDLASLGVVRTLRFELDSSDRGVFGMNTPAYFCLDTIVPAVGPGSTSDVEPTPADSGETGEDPVGVESIPSSPSVQE